VNIVQVICIVASVVMILDSINLIANKFKKLVESSMKFRIFCNSSINGAIAKNYTKTAKIMGIQGIICGMLFLILSININNTELNGGSTGLFIVLGITVFNLFILGVVVPSIK
jgi:hypothetical protein